MELQYYAALCRITNRKKQYCVGIMTEKNYACEQAQLREIHFVQNCKYAKTRLCRNEKHYVCDQNLLCGIQNVENREEEETIMA